MMDPTLLVDQAAAGLPAPVWFVQFFKVLGFALHAVPMNLWFAGLPVALLLLLRRNGHARYFGGRLLRQMPVIVALGVNLGIVPLLFVQLAYYKVFYPATILMAWFWLAIVVLLIPAYYGVYAYAWGYQKNSGKTCSWRIAAGWCSAVLFLAIGFFFVNGLSLMEHVGNWPPLWDAANKAGAALGTALNLGDATLWPRWLLMLGLALQTTAVWVLFDAEWLGGKAKNSRGPTAPGGQSCNSSAIRGQLASGYSRDLSAADADDAYRRWAWGFAGKLYTVGLLWFALAGSIYVFVTWTPELREAMFAPPWIVLTVLTAIAPGLPLMLVLLGGRIAAMRTVAALAAAGQFGVLGVNAISRQVVQNMNLKPYWDVLSMTEDVQWGPLAMFLAAFVVCLSVVGWMVAQVRKCSAS